jgi:serine/threonine-protein kinase
MTSRPPSPAGRHRFTNRAARQVGIGLGAAKAAGIVHRDLKPQNLFLVNGVWKILDFGVSKLLEHGSTLTEGETVGSPQYMAPEQARGGDVGASADLYALGAIAYRAVTRQRSRKISACGHMLRRCMRARSNTRGAPSVRADRRP